MGDLARPHKVGDPGRNLAKNNIGENKDSQKTIVASMVAIEIILSIPKITL